MKKTTITPQFVLYTKKLRNDIAPIYLRLTQDRKSIYVSTPFSCKEKEWNKDKHQVRHPGFQYMRINNWMKNELAKISDITLDNPNLTKEQLKEILTKKDAQEKDFFDVYSDFHKQLLKDGHYDEAKHTRVIEGKIKALTKSDKVPISQIDPSFITHFQDFMLNKLNNSKNTVNKEMTRLKRVLTYAKKEGYLTSIPYDDYTPFKKTKSRKAKLTYKQIIDIENLELKKGSQIAIVRDAFLFAFYNGGIRFGDLCRLTWNDIKNGRLTYQMSKTGIYKDFTLMPKPLEIIKRYKKKPNAKSDSLLPIIEDAATLDLLEFNKKKSSKNARFNALLKEIAELANIEETLSFHIARHSFADYARKVGIAVTDIKNMLGHSSIAVTQDYLNDLDKQSLDEGIHKLFG